MFINDRIERDAWGAFRGYIYQANISIIEWLNLEDYNQVIQLEAGEDIDKIYSDKKRILMQVKHIQGSITLRNKEVYEAIANCAYHMKENSSGNLELVFEFYTNAASGNEKGDHFKEIGGGNSNKGLDLWNEIHNGGLEHEDEDKYVEEIINILQEKLDSKTKGFVWEYWNPYLRSVTVGDFKKVIKTLSWKTQEISFEESTKKIIKILKNKGYGTHNDDYEKVYYSLLNFALDQLSQKGTKKLTKEILHRKIFEAARRDLDAIKFALLEFIEEEEKKPENQHFIKQIEKLKKIESTLAEIEVVEDGDSSAAIDIALNKLMPYAEKIDKELYKVASSLYYDLLQIKKTNITKREFSQKVKSLFVEYKRKVEDIQLSLLK
ncbi:hypothetical protein CN451_24910 [Priestia megaterium]|uniref:hypothetical protein n=1 Tax=Priestia megaterium TaxID=1404 RepID=UPI000BF3DDC7|nr:hypothetical protein [Priestia megaterium]PEX06584.1 hypothetical protein CN451_24910 [Priestia megaterium]